MDITSNGTGSTMSFQNASSELLPESLSTRLLRAGFDLDKAVTPYLCLFGALGNSLSIALFSLNRNYRRQSSSYYLSTLAISDTGFLLNLFLVWYESMHGGVITSGFTCRLVMYLGQVTCFVSIYVMVGFSIERYIAVRNPLSRRQICTKSRARKGILGVSGAALLLFSYVWFIARLIEIVPKPNGSNVWLNEKSFASSLLKAFLVISYTDFNFSEESNINIFVNLEELTSTDKQLIIKFLQRFKDASLTRPVSANESLHENPLMHYCSVPKKYHHISKVANYLDTVFTLIIPFLIILFCNTNIVWALRKLQKERQKLLPTPTTQLVSKKRNKTTDHTTNPPNSEPLNSRRWKSDANLGYPSVVGNRTKLCKRGNLHEQQTEIFQSVCTSKLDSSEARATSLLLLVSSIFLLLNLPLHVIRCAQFFQTLTGSSEEKGVFAALQPWANLLFNTNFALNFVLYCVSGKNFRRYAKYTALALCCKTAKTPLTQQKAISPCLLQNDKKIKTRQDCEIQENFRKGGSLRSLKTELEQQADFVPKSKADKGHATTL